MVVGGGGWCKPIIVSNPQPSYFALLLGWVAVAWLGFGVMTTILRSIMMRLIYLDFYTILDESMSDSQVGGRKAKNIRNYVWIVNGIIGDVLNSKIKKPVDIQIYDYRQCFDSLWLQECLNDLYSAGLNNDKLALHPSPEKIQHF